MTGKTRFQMEQPFLIIHLEEELDHHNALEIRQKADGLIERQYLKYIIFDFTNTTFMDSSGIGVIMGRYRQIRYLGGKVAVCGISGMMERIYQLSGLRNIIPCYETIQQTMQEMLKAE